MSSECFLITLLICLNFFHGLGAGVPGVIAFGDSSLDTGNNNHISTFARSDFEPYGRDFEGGKPTGRFCNGKIAADFISESLGLKSTMPAYLDPAYNVSDFASGVTFASAATGYDNATSSVLSVLPLWKELEYYKDYQKKLRSLLGEARANLVISDSIYIISAGTNDFLENYFASPGRSSDYSTDRYEDFLVGIAGNFVRTLHGLGARKISLGGLPPMGCMPLERSTNFAGPGDCNQQYNDVAVEFNGKMKNLVGNLNKELPGVKIVFSDPYDLFMRIINTPSSYGFEVASTACCASGMYEMGYTCSKASPSTCSNADKYVFWDSFHPTQRTNRILADYLVKSAMPALLQ